MSSLSFMQMFGLIIVLQTITTVLVLLLLARRGQSFAEYEQAWIDGYQQAVNDRAGVS